MEAPPPSRRPWCAAHYQLKLTGIKVVGLHNACRKPMPAGEGVASLLSFDVRHVAAEPTWPPTDNLAVFRTRLMLSSRPRALLACLVFRCDGLHPAHVALGTTENRPKERLAWSGEHAKAPGHNGGCRMDTDLRQEKRQLQAALELRPALDSEEFANAR